MVYSMRSRSEESMPAASPLSDHLSIAELRDRYLTASSRIEGIRWHALLLRAQGRPQSDIAEITQRSSRWVSATIRRYNDGGPDAIADQRVSNGKPPDLTVAQQDALHQLLQSPPPDGGIWTGLKVLAWIEAQVGGKRNLATAYNYIHRLNLPRHAERARPQEADDDTR
ncbi:MAG: helix-turn-helix domain-containing protein [Myxococcota bacterium]|nr:helix-turn-helix domain-containing protein [Myxococcota bacterium]